MDYKDSRKYCEGFIKCLIECDFKITDDNKNLINFNLEFIKEETVNSVFFGVAFQFNCIKEIIELTGIDINNDVGNSDHDILYEILRNDNIIDITDSINQIDKLGFNFEESYALLDYLSLIENQRSYINPINLHYNKNIETCIPLLVEKGLDINIEYFGTALCYAVSVNECTLVKVILDNGASPYIGVTMELTDKKCFGQIIDKYTDDVSKVLQMSHDIVRNIMTFIYK